MAFENMTYEVILHQMMNRVIENYPNLDTREGSVLFNALAPAALEMAILYTELDNAIKESFVDTASREYILTHCKQMGMETDMFDASAGVHLGIFNVEVPIGSRWNCDLYNYVVEELYDGDYSDIRLPDDIPEPYFAYRLACETTGAAPNNTTGEMTPIGDTPANLSYKELITCLIQGENETSDEDMRKEYYYYVNDTQVDGNVAQYEKWCRDFDGIGNHKIIPRWYNKETNEEETVKVLILDVDNTKASQDLIDKFQDYLDPGKNAMGNGQAPIGAKVTVATAKEKPISVEAEYYATTDNFDSIALYNRLEEYFREISFAKKDGKYIDMIPYMTLGAELTKTLGIGFIDKLKVDGGTDNINLAEDEIPVINKSGTMWIATKGV